jgi:hypothetical protein
VVEDQQIIVSKCFKDLFVVMSISRRYIQGYDTCHIALIYVDKLIMRLFSPGEGLAAAVLTEFVTLPQFGWQLLHLKNSSLVSNVARCF